jgi:hypothetical protein
VLGGMAVAVPFAARAQQPTGVRRLSVLLNLSENDPEAQRLITVFREQLAQLGWADGRNLRIDYRWSGGDVGRVRAFAKELVELSPDVVVGYATPAVLALQQETHAIPIVFLAVTDPVGQGIVASLAHPGGNITGFQDFEMSLGAKWMEALKQIAPNLNRVTTIFNPETPCFRVVADDGQVVSRCDVPARGEVRCRIFGRHPERDLDLADVAFELGSATHRSTKQLRARTSLSARRSAQPRPPLIRADFRSQLPSWAHDLDGHADHVGGALLSARALRHFWFVLQPTALKDFIKRQRPIQDHRLAILHSLDGGAGIIFAGNLV